MKYLIISVRDNAVEAYQPVATVRAKGQGIRSFQDLLQKDENLSAHPADYDLYLVGEFDDQTGELTATKPERLVRGADFQKH